MRMAAALLALVLSPLPAVGQPLPKQIPPKPVQKQPNPQAELDKLFQQLAKAGTEEEAQALEARIQSAFEHTGSPSIDLLMSRSNQALEAGDSKTAGKLYTAIIGFAPNYAEAWNRRGQLLAASGDDANAMIALQKAVQLNPRNFVALMALGNMLDEYGNKAAALAMLRRALALDPHLPGVDRHVRELSRAVEGQEL